MDPYITLHSECSTFASVVSFNMKKRLWDQLRYFSRVFESRELKEFVVDSVKTEVSQIVWISMINRVVLPTLRIESRSYQRYLV